MQIRNANNGDLDEIRTLFYDTVTTINVKDYDADQIKIWASGSENIDNWQNRIKEQYFLIAETEEIIIGFASMTHEGYVDLMYVHHEYQDQGIATTLLSALEADAKELQISHLIADVSITARTFFEARGFIVEEDQEKMIKEVLIRNFRMKKKLG